MRREQRELPLPGHEGSLSVVVHGHYGRPVVVFPTEAGRAADFENNGMVDAVADLVDAGRAKLYCVDSLDSHSWADTTAPIEERAHRHGLYTDWLANSLLPFVHEDTGGGAEPMALGCSLGAYHAVHLALQRADLVPLAIGLSGNYDVGSWRAWGDPGDAAYFANPADYVPHLHGDHLSWLQSRVSLLLVVGQGDWETHPTGALPSTKAMAQMLQDKGIRCELDLWGHDVAHDWPWWGRQLAHHLPRFC
ncbi:MAG: alpha/beta hydrolase-fold protein [Actinomycetota bacterium]|nr:alpha/beta hydrolase-fold protein [Actinomycetota bacterium]